MRIWAILLVALALLGSCACSRRDEDQAERKVGKAAHQIEIESRKVAKEAAREVDHATREAHEGWKEAQHPDKSKDKK